MNDDTLSEKLKTGFPVTTILQQFPAVTSGYTVLRSDKEFIPWSTRITFDQLK